MNSAIYLDNSATTAPCDTAIKYINSALTENWGNPSSLHSVGISAEALLSGARKKAASMIGAEECEIFFTSGGTEANNIAILGACERLKRRGNRIVTTEIEHPSVMETVNHLSENGFEVIYLKPDKNGVISKEDIFAAVNDKTILVSIMLVNNELGAVEPIAYAAEAVKAAGAPALIHCDAVQAFGKLPINVKKLGIDLLSVSGHKIHGPKGVGFLYKKRSVNLASPIFGGGQEGGVRSGTHPMPAIAGLLGAMEELTDINGNLDKAQALCDYAKAALTATGLIKINSGDSALPYILNITVSGYKSETLLHFLDSKGIFVSSGSACAKGKKSYVLKSVGLSDKDIDCSLRLSFSRFNTTNDIDKLCTALAEACRFIRKAY